MRWLLWIVLGAAVIWGGLWFAGARTLERAVRDGLARLTPFAEAGDVAVAGFPNRLDLTLSEPRLADPATGAEWSAPFVQVLSLAYRPWHVIAVLPPEQRVRLPDGRDLALASDSLRASVVVTPGGGLALDRITLVGQGLRLVLAPAGGTLRADDLRLATRRDADQPLRHELGIEVAGFLPDPAFRAAFPSGRPAPEGAAALRLDAFVTLTAPLDRFAADTRPSVRALDLADLALNWDEIRLTGKGQVVADAKGRAEGKVDLVLDGWPQALDVAVAAGALQPGVAETWAAFARQLADPAKPDRLALPLVMAGGWMTLGPLPMGRAPRLGPRTD